MDQHGVEKNNCDLVNHCKNVLPSMELPNFYSAWFVRFYSIEQC